MCLPEGSDRGKSKAKHKEGLGISLPFRGGGRGRGSACFFFLFFSLCLCVPNPKHLSSLIHLHSDLNLHLRRREVRVSLQRVGHLRVGQHRPVLGLLVVGVMYICVGCQCYAVGPTTRRKKGNGRLKQTKWPALLRLDSLTCAPSRQRLIKQSPCVSVVVIVVE